MPDITDKDIARFRRKLWRFFTANRRDLPFRRTDDPYKIAVAEIMLQQTQVERVVPKYEEWIKTWPDWMSLAKAAPRDLLAAWSGLGYNRRAIHLGKMAERIVTDFGGQLPDSVEDLETLPGIGPYTSRAILIFAFNRNIATIDTNIRRVIIHEFGLENNIDKAALENIARRLVPKGRSRDWHNALMDFGAMILTGRRTGIAPASRQSRFTGSIRQIRGEIIRRLTDTKRLRLADIARDMNRSPEDVNKAASGLERDGLIIVGEKTIRLKDS